MITQKTNAVQREIDRTDNPLDTLNKIYETLIMTVIKLKKFDTCIFASVYDGFLVVVVVLRAIMLIIKYQKYQLAPASDKISSKVL